jgi:hypothetical protein
MNRKGFFKTLFGGFLAATAAPSLLKSEEKPQPIQEFHPLKLQKKSVRVGITVTVGEGC